MAYVNIKDSEIVNAIAKQVGVVQEVATQKVYELVNDSIQRVRREACPDLTSVNRLQTKIQAVQGSIGGISRRIEKFNKIAKLIITLITVFKVVKALVLKLPVPQAVPPGIGLPVGFSMIQTDILHKFKEKIRQGGDDAKGIVAVLKTPKDNIKTYTKILGRINLVTNGCRLEGILRREVARGRITEERLKALGIIKETRSGDEYIFSSLGSNLFSDSLLDRRGNFIETNSAGGISPTDKNTLADNAEKDLFSSLQKLDGENSELDKAISDLFDVYKAPTDDKIGTNPDFYYTGANGEIYELKIKLDPDSPSIAPRRFAVAIDKTGVEVLKGPKSFSSSTKVLLDEIKFRIDNQLP